MANFNYNKVTLAGRLVADPELRETQNDISVANARIAVTRRSFNGEEPATDFFNIVAWRGGADFLAKYFKKGSSVCVNGTLQTGTYTDANGDSRYYTEVVADEIYFVDSKSENAERAQDTKPAANKRNDPRSNPTRNRR